MNNLRNAYSLYFRADAILRFIDGRKGKTAGRWIFKKDGETNLIIKLLVAHELIETVMLEKKETLILTEKGKAHLAAGGFGYQLLPEKEVIPVKTFKDHLDNLTGLLTIFGILNAVILFAQQVKQPVVADSINLNPNAVQFISVSMYLISIMVLWEIIWLTLNETQNSFKFQALYFLLCTTTLGIGMLFLSEFFPLISALVGVAAFFAVAWGVFSLLLRGLTVVITKRNAQWMLKYTKPISLMLFFTSMLVALGLLHLILSLFFKK